MDLVAQSTLACAVSLYESVRPEHLTHLDERAVYARYSFFFVGSARSQLYLPLHHLLRAEFILVCIFILNQLTLLLQLLVSLPTVLFQLHRNNINSYSWL